MTFGSGDSYVTNGVTANLLLDGAKKYISVIPEYNSVHTYCQFNKTTGKIQFFVTGAAETNPLEEMANASTATESATCEFLVIAK